ncbi:MULTISPECIES: hypothetical protein [Streptomyces]|uniref:hypothetical protein n=1 Tax=Streptomyces TaxID=1883 RepID=UPI00277D0D37|nr:MULTISPECIES: hypothetical protein [Streptomyces]
MTRTLCVSCELLAAKLENLGDDVDTAVYWDGGHGANEDAADFIKWIAKVTGHKA